MLTKIAQVTIETPRIVEREEALQHEGATEQFKKLVANVRRVAPKSDEFLYFSCLAISAMERANLDKEGSVVGDGHIIEAEDGKCTVCGEKVKKFENGLWHSAKGIEPYVNANGDAFPERQLTAGYKSFVGKGFFVNHASEDVEKLRGIILDAVWIPKYKCVDLLVACDRVAFPELARQIKAGYMHDVSMGTQVQYSLCSECGNKAIVEADYCSHVKSSKGRMNNKGKNIYEINYGLNFIEISAVSVGADKDAKIRQIIASLNTVAEKRAVQIEQIEAGTVCATKEELAALKNDFADIKAQLNTLSKQGFSGADVPLDSGTTEHGLDVQTEARRKKHDEDVTADALKKQNAELHYQLLFKENEIQKLTQGGNRMAKDRAARKIEREAYMQGTTEPTTYPVDKLQDQLRAKEDRHMVGKGMETGDTGLAGNDLKIKQDLLRAKNKTPVKVAYPQGTEEPKVYPKDKLSETDRNKEDKHMVGKGMETGDTGLAGDDLKIKEKLLRASLKAVFKKAETKPESSWTILAVEQGKEEPILTASVDEIFGKDVDKEWDWVASKAYGQEVIKAIREQGFDKVAYLLKGAQSPAAQEKLDMGAPEGEDASLSAELDKEVPAEGDVAPEEVEDTVSSTLDEIEMALDKLRSLIDVEEKGEGEEGLEGAADETGDELFDLEEGLGEAKAAKDTAKFTKLAELAVEKVEDAREIVEAINTVVEAKKKEKKEKKDKKCPECGSKMLGGKYCAKCKKKVSKESWLAKRKEARAAVVEAAEKLYDVSPAPAGEALINDAHKEKNKEIAPATGDGGVVENIIEQQQKDMAAVNKMPSGEMKAAATAPTKTAEDKEDKKEDKKVIDDAKEIKEDAKDIIKEEKKDKKAVDYSKMTKEALFKLAEVDSAAKAYWSQFYGEGDAASKAFGKDMSKDFSGQAPAKKADINETKLRMKRAYEVALDAQNKGLIDSGMANLEKHVDNLIDMDDAAFSSYSKVIASTKSIVKEAGLVKEASAVISSVPQIGMTERKDIETELNEIDWS